MIGEASIAQTRPRFAPHVRLTYDRNRSRWTILAPERILVIDEIAAAILERCDGQTLLWDIARDMVGRFAGSPEAIARDVLKLVSDLSGRGILRL